MEPAERSGDTAINALLRYILLLPLAYIFALFCGAATMAIALVGVSDGTSAAVALGFTLGFTVYGGMISFLPALAFVILAEAFGWRALIAYIAAGGAIGLLAGETVIAFDGLAGAEHIRLAAIAAGFVAGTVYWLIAGKFAGLRSTRR